MGATGVSLTTVLNSSSKLLQKIVFENEKESGKMTKIDISSQFLETQYI